MKISYFGFSAFSTLNLIGFFRVGCKMKNFDIAFNHLTLVNSQAITQAVSPSKDGILTASDSGLTLYSVDDGKLVRQTSQALFATVRRIARFALPGDSKKETYVIATSDSGKISMLRASASGKVLVSQTHETGTDFPNNYID